jgi:hypothetical protein
MPWPSGMLLNLNQDMLRDIAGADSATREKKKV